MTRATKPQATVTSRAIPEGKAGVRVQANMVSPLMNRSYDVRCDEPPEVGGDGNAPPPLVMLSAALAACMTTQIRNFSRRMRLSLDDLEVTATCSWSMEVKPDGTYDGHPESFAVEVRIDSGEPQDALHTLVERAQLGCFVAQTIARDTPVSHRLTVREPRTDA